jgi:hypothetical protein
MKTIRWILGLFFTLVAMVIIAQPETETNTAQQSVISAATDGFNTFLQLMDWIYIIIFVVLAWLINDLTDAKNTATWLNWYQKIPKVVRTFILGLILMFVFGYFYRSIEREEYFSLFSSLIFSMVLYKLGLNWMFDKMSTYLFGFNKKV